MRGCVCVCYNSQIMSSSSNLKSPRRFYKYGKISCPVCLKAPRGIKMDLQIKVGGVLKNSGNFQSNEHRNFVF